MSVCSAAKLNLLICLLVTVVSLSFALTLPSVDSLIQDSNVSSATIQAFGGKAVDPRFTALFNDGTDDLSDKSVYMSVLKTLKDMSRHDFNYRCPGGRWSIPGYKDIEIVVDPNLTAATEFQWRFAIWGLFLLVRRLHYSNFVNSRAMLLWEGTQGVERVGYIDVKKSPTFTGTAAAAVAYATQSTQPDLGILPLEVYLQSDGIRNRTSASTDISNTYSRGDGVNIAIDVTGPRLPKWGVFYDIYTAIVVLASLPQNMQIGLKNLITSDPTSNTKLNIEPWLEPRTVPPYFIPSTAITGLARIPGYMYRKNRFNEVRFVFEVDTTPVGYGYIRKDVGLSLSNGTRSTGSTSSDLTAFLQTKSPVRINQHLA